MTLSCKVNDTVNLLVLHQLVERIEITDIHADKLVIWLILNIFEVSQITSVCQLVQIDDVVLRVLVYKQTNYMVADKSGTTSNNYIPFHYYQKLVNYFENSGYKSIS